MLRPSAIALVALTTCNGAAADSVSAITAVWDHFEKVCGPAMADPKGFVDGLASWAPPDSYGTVSTPDGKMFRATIRVPNFSDYFGVTVIGDKMNESCSVHYVGDGIASVEETAAAFVQFIAANFADAEISGGWLPEQYREGGDQPSGPILNNDDNYEYVIEGAPHDADYTVHVQIIGGWMLVSSNRTKFRGQ